jgi:uncharacterized protein YndB with AHSA1/START domain
MTTTGDRSAVLTLPADDQILITRSFDAPPDLVYKAWTTPEIVSRWWTAKRATADSIEIDLREGGRWRFVSHTFAGQEVSFHGEYREIVPGERIVSTEVYEGAPGTPEEQEAGGTVNTITFEEEDGGTKMTMLIQCPSREVRDAVVDSGMEDGLQDALDLLEEEARALA